MEGMGEFMVVESENGDHFGLEWKVMEVHEVFDEWVVDEDLLASDIGESGNPTRYFRVQPSCSNCDIYLTSDEMRVSTQDTVNFLKDD